MSHANTTMQVMPNSPRVPDVPALLPELHLLRGTSDSEPRQAANSDIGMLRAPKVSAGRLACARAPGRPNPQAGVRTAGDWSGRAYGARKPDEDETPLSEDEVIVGIRDGAFLKRGDWQ